MQQNSERQYSDDIAPVEGGGGSRVPEGRGNRFARRGVNVSCRKVEVFEEAEDGGGSEDGLCGWIGECQPQ